MTKRSTVRLGETIVKEWLGKNVRATELLDYARLRPAGSSDQESFL